MCASTNQGELLCRTCIDEIEGVVEEEEDELTQSARLSLNEEDAPSKPQTLSFLHAGMLSHPELPLHWAKLPKRKGKGGNFTTKLLLNHDADLCSVCILGGKYASHA